MSFWGETGGFLDDLEDDGTEVGEESGSSKTNYEVSCILFKRLQ